MVPTPCVHAATHAAGIVIGYVRGGQRRRIPSTCQFSRRVFPRREPSPAALPDECAGTQRRLADRACSLLSLWTPLAMCGSERERIHARDLLQDGREPGQRWLAD